MDEWWDAAPEWEKGGVPRDAPPRPERGMKRTVKEIFLRIFEREEEVEDDLQFEDRIFRYTSQTTVSVLTYFSHCNFSAGLALSWIVTFRTNLFGQEQPSGSWSQFSFLGKWFMHSKSACFPHLKEYLHSVRESCWNFLFLSFLPYNPFKWLQSSLFCISPCWSLCMLISFWQREQITRIHVKIPVNWVYVCRSALLGGFRVWCIVLRLFKIRSGLGLVLGVVLGLRC